ATFTFTFGTGVGRAVADYSLAFGVPVIVSLPVTVSFAIGVAVTVSFPDTVSFAIGVAEAGQWPRRRVRPITRPTCGSAHRGDMDPCWG
ncbi:MAG TPA: hypothetical protein VGZ50_08960, partial [Actinomycetota bacterium]|nr:hypothetical protein [Actinomycetota bacterium]